MNVIYENDGVIVTEEDIDAFYEDDDILINLPDASIEAILGGSKE